MQSSSMAKTASAYSPSTRLLVFIGLILTMVMGALDQSIVSTALPTIVSDLGGLAHMSWVVTAFMLPPTIATPMYGKLSEYSDAVPCWRSVSGRFSAHRFCAGSRRTCGTPMVWGWMRHFQQARRD